MVTFMREGPSFIVDFPVFWGPGWILGGPGVKFQAQGGPREGFKRSQGVPSIMMSVSSISSRRLSSGFSYSYLILSMCVLGSGIGLS